MIRPITRLLLTILAATTAIAHPIQDPPFEGDIRKFEADDAKNPPAKSGIVFVGSSTIVRWSTLKQDFPGLNVINRGFGGSELADSVRYAQRIVTPYAPRLVVVFAGTNDIAAGKSTETVSQNFDQFVSKVREKLPKARIAYIAITPAPSRWAKLEVVKRANEMIRATCEKGPNLTFIDTFSKFLTKEGGPRPELFVSDQLHLNIHGYAILVAAVKPVIDSPLPRGTSGRGVRGEGRLEVTKDEK